MNKSLLTAACTAGLMAFSGAQAADQASNDSVKIGVLTDMSGVYKAIEGPGAVIAAQMAADDFGGQVLGAPIEIVSADHQNKADVASSIARKWIDQNHVDMLVGMDNSAVGLAVQGLASEKNTITINTGAGSSELTESQCSKYGIHYVYDTYALPVGTATAIVKNGGKKWFFITADYAFGHSLRDNTSRVVKELGGEVLGSIEAPLSSTDFSSYLLQASGSGADVIGLANAGGDTVNSIKQANAFGIVERGQKLAGMLVFLTDVKALGLDTAKGLEFTTAFYWDRNDESRKWSQRFFDKHGAMPTMVQAGVYSSVTHYLEAIRAAGSDEAAPVRKQLGEMQLNDFFVKNGKIEANGLMSHDMYLAQVKTPEESKSDWDLLNIVSTIPAEKAYIALSDSACPLLK
ncbi:ABC transporter substrate-binding protein [Salinisphaera sp. T31B1]|uniref:ABC transporter substrate-binding protein n=1 Tax=Salinisphaera sp. T31B1 TaxID=727963 RepID=UPI00333FE142